MDYVALAKCLGSHGLQGELRVDPYNPDSELFAPGRTLFLKEGATYEARRVLSVRRGNLGILLTITGVSTREEAKALYGRELFVKRADLPPTEDDDTHYVVDLIGIEVVEEEGGRVYGKVVDMLPGTAQDCFVVRDEAGVDAYVPACHPIVTRFALDERRVYVALPPGLWELYHEG